MVGIAYGLKTVHITFLNQHMGPRGIITERDKDVFNKRFRLDVTVNELMELWYSTPGGPTQKVWYF